LGHAKLDTTALYTRVATNAIREVMSPLDRLTPLVAKKEPMRRFVPEEIWNHQPFGNASLVAHI